jgi:hypothetical protein
MLDAFLARYGNQDIHRLRGVEELTPVEKRVFAACLAEHIKNEVGPREDGSS